MLAHTAALDQLVVLPFGKRPFLVDCAHSIGIGIYRDILGTELSEDPHLFARSLLRCGAVDQQ